MYCCNCLGCWENLKADNATHTDFLSEIDKDSSDDVDLQEFEKFNSQMPQNMLVYVIFTLLDENKMVTLLLRGLK